MTSSRSRRLRPRISVFLILGALAVVIAGAGFAALESRTVSSYWDGLWWALSLITTVGFVGEVPETTGGQILSAAVMLMGFAMLTVTTAAVASLFVREEEEPEEAREREFEDRLAHQLDEITRRLEVIEQALTQPPPPRDLTPPPGTEDGGRRENLHGAQ